MKKFLAVICVIFGVLAFSLYSKPSMTYSISDYGCWPDDTANTLNTNFRDSLPAQNIVRQFGSEYYYNSRESVLGNRSFVIYIELVFPDKESYETELEKYAALLSNPILQDDNTYYLIQYSNKAFEMYVDQKIYDGMFFDFEVMSTNENQFAIRFLNAHVWDSYKDETLVNYLMPLDSIN